MTFTLYFFIFLVFAGLMVLTRILHIRPMMAVGLSALGAVLVSFLDKEMFSSEHGIAVYLSPVLGVLAVFVILGLVGNKLGVMNYSYLFLFAALFPWYAGWKVSLVSIFFATVCIGLYTEFRKFVAYRQQGLRYMSLKRAEQYYTKEEFAAVSENAGVFYFVPLLISFALTYLLFLM